MLFIVTGETAGGVVSSLLVELFRLLLRGDALRSTSSAYGYRERNTRPLRVMYGGGGSSLGSGILTSTAFFCCFCGFGSTLMRVSFLMNLLLEAEEAA